MYRLVHFFRIALVLPVLNATMFQGTCMSPSLVWPRKVSGIVLIIYAQCMYRLVHFFRIALVLHVPVLTATTFEDV